MPRSSFRWLFRRFVPGGDPCKQAVFAAALLAAGCGGGGQHVTQKVVQGTGYSFSTPADWQIVRVARQTQAVAGKGSLSLVSVSRLPLLHAYSAALWEKVVPELDHVADGLARQQHGSITDSRTVTISGERARRYKVAYDLRGQKLVEEIAFVLRGKTEFLLLCRYEQSASHDACDTLMSSFRLV